jgi:hypothetical protein
MRFSIPPATCFWGIGTEKWTQGKPVRTVFDGLVDIETFNRANRGKVVITENGDDLTVTTEMAPPHQVNKGVRNPEFAYRKFIGCSVCGSPMYGSTSRGRNGTQYPAYHCNKGHYFRVPKDEFEATILEFVKQIIMTPEQIELVVQAVTKEWERRQQAVEAEIERYDEQVKQLGIEAELTVKKLKFLESETAIKYMEGDLVAIENKISKLKDEREEKTAHESVNMEQVVGRVKYFLENLDKLLIKQIDPVKKAQFFGVLFDRIPTYEEIKTRNTNNALLTGVNELFQLALTTKPCMVAPLGLEPRTQGSSSLCSTN